MVFYFIKNLVECDKLQKNLHGKYILKKTPNKKIAREKVLNILNKIQKGRNQINFDSESARMTLAEIIASELEL